MNNKGKKQSKKIKAQTGASLLNSKDAVMYMVGSGKDLKDPSFKENFEELRALHGAANANKILTSVASFNSLPGPKMSPEQRFNQWLELSHNDDYVSSLGRSFKNKNPLYELPQSNSFSNKKLLEQEALEQIPAVTAKQAFGGNIRPLFTQQQMAMYGADIEPFVYNGYTDNTPIVRSNWHDPKKKLTAQGGQLMPTAQTVGKRNALNQWGTGVNIPVPQWEYNEETDAPAPIAPMQLSEEEQMRRTGLGPTPKRQDFEMDIQKAYDTNPKVKRKYDKSLEPQQQKDKMNPIYAGIAALSFISDRFQGSPKRSYYEPQDEPYYNPFPQGLGSQAIAEQGGWIEGTNAVEFPYKSGIKFEPGGSLKNKYYPQNGEIMNVGAPKFPIARTGENIRINYGGNMQVGGELSLYDDTTGVQPVSDNPHSAPIIKFLGPDHGEKNNIGTEGVPINYEGTPVEVFGGEHATIDSKGNMQIFGDMKNPLMGNKKTFNQTAKEIAKEENKANKKLQKGLNLLNSAKGDDPYEMLTFNSGRLKMQGANSQLKELSQIKELTAAVQEEKLQLARSLGIEPMDLDKKAKHGKMVKAQGGFMSKKFTRDNGSWGMTDSSKNPYLKPAPQPVAPTPYVSGVRPNRFDWWNDVAPASASVPPPTKQKGSTSDRQVTTLKRTAVEDKTPETQPVVTTTPNTTPITSTTPNKATEVKKSVEGKTSNTQQTQQSNNIFYTPGTNNLESDATGLDRRNVAGEVYTTLTEQPEPVFMQKYRLDLMQPYEVSYQDRINRNNAIFRAASQTAKDNPSAQAVLAAQNYTANQDVAAEEFRYNQGTAYNVYNQNKAISNETQKLNLGLAEQQAHKQALARSNTRRNRLDALNSFASKDLMHDAAMNKLRAYENMYDFRFDPRYALQYAGPNAPFSWPNVATYTPSATTKQTTPDSKTSVQRTKTSVLPTGQKVVEKKTDSKKFGGSIVRDFKNYKY